MSQWSGQEIVAYSDGACLGNPGAGGWAAVITSRQGLTLAEHAGSEANTTTNSRMELMGAIEALERTEGAAHTTVCTDSQYVKNGITEWIGGWKRKGWRSASGKPVKNQDLWKRLDAARSGREVRWQWVPGHSGVPGNERADALASEAAERARTRGPETRPEPGPAPGAPAPGQGGSEIPFDGSVAELIRMLQLMREETQVRCVLKLEQ